MRQTPKFKFGDKVTWKKRKGIFVTKQPTYVDWDDGDCEILTTSHGPGSWPLEVVYQKDLTKGWRRK